MTYILWFSVFALYFEEVLVRMHCIRFFYLFRPNIKDSSQYIAGQTCLTHLSRIELPAKLGVLMRPHKPNFYLGRLCIRTILFENIPYDVGVLVIH